MVAKRERAWLGWQERSLCATPEAQEMARSFINEDGTPATLLQLFYPTTTDPNPRKRIQAVQKLCNACPVQQECIEYALSTNEPDGIWGGLTRSARDKMRTKGNEVE